MIKAVIAVVICSATNIALAQDVPEFYENTNVAVGVPVNYLSTSQGYEKGQKDNVVPQAYRTISEKVGVPAKVLYAVAKVESGNYSRYMNKRLPWPWTLNIEGVSHFYANKHQAVKALNDYLKTGHQSVAVGLMQIYWRWHKLSLKNPEKALDPYYNIKVGAQYLKEMHKQSHGDWWKAIGLYHTKEVNERTHEEAMHYRYSVVAELETLH